MATVSKEEMVKAVRAHAKAHYEKGGWDILVECWDDAQILEAIGNRVRTVNGAIASCYYALKPSADQRADIMAEVF